MNEFDTMTLLLLLYASFGTKSDDWEEYKAQMEREKEMQENCPMIEWEQDMGAHVPFCKRDGDMCNMQCMRPKTQHGMGREP